MRAHVVATVGLVALAAISLSCAPTDDPPPVDTAPAGGPDGEQTNGQGNSRNAWGVSVDNEDDARRKLPFESLVGRLPQGKPISPTEPLSAEAKERWEIFDHNTASTQERRSKLLKQLHEETGRFFVESPDFGARRVVLPLEPEGKLMDEWPVYEARATKYPGWRAGFPTSKDEPISRVEPTKDFHTVHEDGMWDFLNPRSFGYVKDREHVSGFRSHGFRTLSYPLRVQVQHVQLVGILTQPEPVVYLTDKLPSMEQVRQGKTRALDLFEEAGLAELRKGDDLFIAQKDGAVRMLGALRATKTCLQCHDAKEGDMLGAFSYTLRPVAMK